MIARLTLSMGPRQVVAQLTDTREWRCDDLVTESFLNLVCGPDCDDGGEHTQPGHGQVYAAVRAVENAGWHVALWFAQAEQDAA